MFLVISCHVFLVIFVSACHCVSGDFYVNLSCVSGDFYVNLSHVSGDFYVNLSHVSGDFYFSLSVLVSAHHSFSAGFHANLSLFLVILVVCLSQYSLAEKNNRPYF